MGVEGEAGGPESRSATNGRIKDASEGPTLEQRIGVIEQTVQALASNEVALRVEIATLRNRLLGLLEDVSSTERAPAPAERPTSGEYAELVARVRNAVRVAVPFDATIAVITRGDDDLVKFFGRQGWHFPQDVDGRWLGYHPKNSLAAIAQLATMRAFGADFFVVPAPSYWWFDKYSDFAQRLTSRYLEITADADACRIFSLREPASAKRAVNAFLEQERGERGTVEVLDLTTAGDLVVQVPDVEAFSPPNLGSRLPYADRSIPLVALDSDAPEVRAEADRVASVAVLDIAYDQVSLVEERHRTLPSVSVIMPVYDNPALTEASLETLTATLPPGFAGEVIVVDDGSAEETRQMLDAWPLRNPRVRVLRSPVNRGYLPALATGIDAATGTYLLLVNNDMVFLDGWLEPLLRTFDDFPDAGAVGGRLLYRDGRLQEAGGLLFADGSAKKYGYGDADNDRPSYSFVRQVDYCSGCLLMTPRAVFDAVGGVDRSFDPGYYEDTDYCLRIRLSGRRVYYQPESVVVHVEGGTAGLDTNIGMKRYQALNHRRFVEKWGDTLRELQPVRPDPDDDAAMHALVLHRAPAVSGTT